MNNTSVLKKNYAVATFLIVACFCGILKFDFQPTPSKPDIVFETTPAFYRLVSFGYWPAAVDLLWIEILEKIGHKEQYTFDRMREAFQFYNNGTQLDPYFYELYQQSAIYFSFFFEKSEPALFMIDRGISVYENKNPPAQFWEHAYALYIYRAYVNAFMKNDWAEAKKDYLRAETIPGSPLYLKRMKGWLDKAGSEHDLAVRVLSLLINSTLDPLQKAVYEKKMQQLRGTKR